LDPRLAIAVAAAAIVRSLCWLLALAIGSRDGAWWKLIIVVTVLVLVLGAAGVGAWWFIAGGGARLLDHGLDGDAGPVISPAG
jgi:hypothetical protein